MPFSSKVTVYYLNAVGCGAFRNPPVGQSKLWKQIIFGKEFRGKFKKIIFAIFDDHNAGKDHNPFGNYLPFIETFDITQKRIEEFVENRKKNDDDEQKEDGNAFKVLSEIVTGISDDNASRDLDYIVLNAKLKNNSSAMSVLYCGGFKRSADGSRLFLERERIDIAMEVFKILKAKQSVQNK